VAPARSRTLVLGHDQTKLTERRFSDLGLRLTYGDHVDETGNSFHSCSIASASTTCTPRSPTRCARHRDRDRRLQQQRTPALPGLGPDRAQPQVFCGYYHITVLQNAILARSRLITYTESLQASPATQPRVSDLRSYVTNVQAAQP
jgi:muramoyltetrapeptide carboxypeptidase LdcA involved in peptidoglycan recycling